MEIHAASRRRERARSSCNWMSRCGTPGIVIEIAVGCFPSLGIVEPKLFRVWLFRRGHRILEWNLRDGHELSLSDARLVR